MVKIKYSRALQHWRNTYNQIHLAILILSPPDPAITYTESVDLELA